MGRNLIMGRTFKDQRKYDKKNKQKDTGDLKGGKKLPKRKQVDEIIPPDDELDPYEEYEYEYDDLDYYPRR